MRVRGCALIRERDEILVLVYDYPNGKVHAIPGGSVEEGESLADSVRRELQEELGVDVAIGPLRYVGDMMARDGIGQTVHVVFEGEIVEGTPTLNRDHTSAGSLLWLNLGDLDKVDLYPGINQAILEDLGEPPKGARYLGNCMQREWA